MAAALALVAAIPASPASAREALSPGHAVDGATLALADEERPSSPWVRPLILFVSWSMGQDDLTAARGEALLDGHTSVVLRGVLPMSRAPDALRQLTPLERTPADGRVIEFDPPSLLRVPVFSVPAIYDPLTGSMWRGSSSVIAFRDQLARSTSRFSELRGPETALVEPDLEEVMQGQAARLAVIGRQQRDFRDAAFRDEWRETAFARLPTLATGRERLVDPAVVLGWKLLDADGRVFVGAGERINTLATVPSSHRLIVFDAGDPAQIAWAVRRARDLEDAGDANGAGDGEATRFFTSSVDREAGWDGWQQLVTSLGRPLYVLDQRLAERLRLLAVPSVIEQDLTRQDGPLLRVREIGRDDLPAASGTPAPGVSDVTAP
jgi:conjugal transfer pilus assembly protein TraW